VRYSKEHKALTYEKILQIACRCFHERGINGVSVADLMAAAGLTHGAFYSYFASKDSLIADAVKHGLEQRRQSLEKWGRNARDGQCALEVIIRNYLSRLHRDDPATGCPIPALGAEIARGGTKARTALTSKLKEIVGLLAGFAERGSAQEGQVKSIGLLSALVGAMVLARATNDADFSDAILRASRSFLFETLPRSKKRRPRSRRRVR
jgi:TetR/AcrR family transcriptional repressor of nem operon